MNNELKTELLEALRFHEFDLDRAFNISLNFELKDVDDREDRLNKLRSAIAKLENEPVVEIKLEEQGK
jgi:hypothetical protein